MKFTTGKVNGKTSIPSGKQLCLCKGIEGNAHV